MSYADLQTFITDTSGLPRATTLFREPGLRTLLLHLKPGEEMAEHQTPGAITVHCLKGQVIISYRDEKVTLGPASLVGLGPAIPHSVAAEEDTLLLVTICEQSRDKQSA